MDSYAFRSFLSPATRPFVPADAALAVTLCVNDVERMPALAYQFASVSCPHALRAENVTLGGRRAYVEPVYADRYVAGEVVQLESIGNSANERLEKEAMYVHDPTDCDRLMRIASPSPRACPEPAWSKLGFICGERSIKVDVAHQSLNGIDASVTPANGRGYFTIAAHLISVRCAIAFGRKRSFTPMNATLLLHREIPPSVATPRATTIAPRPYYVNYSTEVLN